jgi:hypothetical protein
MGDYSRTAALLTAFDMQLKPGETSDLPLPKGQVLSISRIVYKIASFAAFMGDALTELQAGLAANSTGSFVKGLPPCGLLSQKFKPFQG